MTPWHLTLATDGRHPMFDDENGVRKAVRALARIAPDAFALFCFADDHVHLVALGESSRIGRLARALVLGLRPVASARVEPARVRPVTGRAHLQSLVKYVLTQPVHHGLAGGAALWTGSCVLELVGARDVGLRLQLAKALPRLRLRYVQAIVGLPSTPIAPATLDEVRHAGIGRLLASAAAAYAVDSALAGNTTPVVEVRRRIAQLAADAGIPMSEVAFGLRMTARAARRLLAPRVASTVAIRVRLGLELAAAAPTS